MKTIGKNKLTNNCGFSLIELVIILIGVSILAALAMQSMTGVITDLKKVKTEREMETLVEAIVGDAEMRSGGTRSDFGYVGDVGAFPPDLEALVVNPGGYATWKGPYVPTGFSEDTDGIKTDEWGKPYIYSGGTIITSAGSSVNIEKSVARSTSDYLLNSFNGSVIDSAGNVPGNIYFDSVDIKITVPNGVGGLDTKLYHPDSAGLFTLDSLPVGQHPIQIIYSPRVDTLYSYLTILPRHKTGQAYKFASAYFGSNSASGVETLYPDGIGSMTELSLSGCLANWECVAETPADGNMSYVAGSGNAYKTDLYNLGNHNTGNGTIDSVKIYAVVNNGGGGSKGKTVIRIGSTDFESGEIILSTLADYTEFGTNYPTNPITAANWTWNDIDNLEIGVSLRKTAPCTQVRVDVFYTN